MDTFQRIKEKAKATAAKIKQKACRNNKSKEAKAKDIPLQQIAASCTALGGHVNNPFHQERIPRATVSRRSWEQSSRQRRFNEARIREPLPLTPVGYRDNPSLRNQRLANLRLKSAGSSAQSTRCQELPEARRQELLEASRQDLLEASRQELPEAENEVCPQGLEQEETSELQTPSPAATASASTSSLTSLPESGEYQFSSTAAGGNAHVKNAISTGYVDGGQTIMNIETMIICQNSETKGVSAAHSEPNLAASEHVDASTKSSSSPALSTGYTSMGSNIGQTRFFIEKKIEMVDACNLDTSSSLGRDDLVTRKDSTSSVTSAGETCQAASKPATAAATVQSEAGIAEEEVREATGRGTSSNHGKLMEDSSNGSPDKQGSKGRRFAKKGGHRNRSHTNCINKDETDSVSVNVKYELEQIQKLIRALIIQGLASTVCQDKHVINLTKASKALAATAVTSQNYGKAAFVVFAGILALGSSLELMPNQIFCCLSVTAIVVSAVAKGEELKSVFIRPEITVLVINRCEGCGDTSQGEDPVQV